MKKISISFLCAIICCITSFGQTNNITPFSGCPNVYIISYKNGTNCTADGVKVYTTDLSANLNTLLFTTSTTQEVNGLAISGSDSKGYGLLYNRIDSINGNCSTGPVQLFRFGANGNRETIGAIPVPSPTIAISTAVGTIDASDNYYFLAGGFNIANPTVPIYYLGKIAAVSTLPAGGAISPTYTVLTNNCAASVFSDWAINPADGQLYSYGIYGSATAATGTLMKIDLSTNTISCLGTQTAGEFTNAILDNFGGIMFGANGFMYGMNVNTRKFYRINASTGAINSVSTIAGGSGPMRSDLASCASFVTPPPTPTPFPCSTTTPTYVIGFKNGTNCTVAPYNVYTMTLAGTLSPTPLFSTPDTIEVNGIGINTMDNRGYSLWYRRDNNSGPNSCINDTVKLIRFGANGAVQLLGYIPQPPGYILNTALGTMGADGAYYYGALINGQLAVGRIANVAVLATGTGPLTATYRTVVNACGGRNFADWAFRPGTNTLYTYGLSADANNTVAGVVMTIDLNAPTVNAVMNCQSATETSGTFTNAAQDNLGGIIFGTDGFMYGVNVNDRRYYRISPTTGAITLVSTFPVDGSGTPTTSTMRTDMGSCVTGSVPPTTFTCPGSYLISYKQGTNCTKNPHGIYAFSNYQTGILNPTPILVTADTIEINAIGLSKVDGFGYGFMYRRDDNTNPGSCINDTIKFFRFGANGVTQILGYVIRPASPALDLSTAVGCMNSSGTFFFSATANGQLYIAKIQRTDTLTSLPNRSIPFSFNAVNITCFRSFADWAISPTTGQLVSYGIYVNPSNQVAGSMVTIDTSTFVLSCYGMETTGASIFTNAGQDNFGGIMYGADAFLYGVNVYDKKYYRISPATGQINLVNTIPAATSTIRTDMASCVTDLTLLPIGFDKPSVTALGECKAALSWNISGAETGDAFVVEKSYDGRNYTTLTTIKAVNGLSNYSTTDDKTGITNYYRVKGVSKNGEVTYSPIVRFLSSCGNKNNITLFQNLISGSAQVAGEVSLYKTQPITATIYNATGVKVFSKTSTMSAGVSRFSYDVPMLSKGVYMLQTVIGEERFVEKFVVQ